jgi:alkylhydroperoxidase family enzyme
VGEVGHVHARVLAQQTDQALVKFIHVVNQLNCVNPG